MRLVGRVSLTAQLESELERAASGQLRCVVLLADPGLGKTRLASELLSRNRRWITPLSARAHPLSATASYGVWAEALERHLRTVPAAEVGALCGGFLDDLATLLRSVAATRGSAPSREPSRLRLLEALTVLLGQLARRAPVVVFLDDVHWADLSSWEAFNYLARNLGDSRLLLLAAARPAELAALRMPTDVLLGLEQEGIARRLYLSPLAPQHLGELAEQVLGHPPPPPLVAWLSQKSRGNPLYALDLVQALLDEQADLAAPSLRRLPEALSERVRNRTQMLDEPTLATLETLAVLGQRVELGELIRISGRPLDRLGEILDELVRARLVAEEERGRELTYEVSHPLVQEAIYRGIGGARRRALHRLIARALLAGGRLADAAPHFTRSAEVGESEAIEVLLAAMRQAEEREAHREALAILGALLELLPADDRRWLGVLDGMAWQAEWVIDHRADADALTGIRAMRVIEQLLEGSGDAARQATVLFRLTSFLAWGSGEVEAARETGRRALELFQQAGLPGRALLAANELAWLEGLSGDLAAQERAAAEVLQAAEQAGDRLAILQAAGSLGMAAAFRGRFLEAEAALRLSRAIADEDGKRYRLTVSLSFLARTLAHEGRLEEAIPLLQEARARNPVHADTLLTEYCADIAWLRGDFRAVVGYALESAARNPGGLSRRRARVMALAAISAAELDRLADAQRYLAQADDIYGGRDWFVYGPVCAWAAGVLAWRTGGAAAALADLRSSSARLLVIGALPAAAFILVDLAEAAAQAGQAALAAESAQHLEDIAEQIDRDLYRAVAAISIAWARLACGDERQALEAAGRAADWLDGSGYAAFHGRALDALGRASAGSDRAQAVAALEGAASCFATCGAAWRRERALEVLSGLGRAGRRAATATTGPRTLSTREQEVARLAARGYTAREIAEQLVLGERTVETHLANAYLKLGVDSKRELVRRADELGL